jgi:hypothetical protein
MKTLFRTIAVAGLAVFLVFPLGTVSRAGELFDDVPDTHTFFGDVSWLGVTGITRGCNPPVNDLFCPDDNVTRGQMAAFVGRALDYRDGGEIDFFTDDDGTIFEMDINRLAAAGVTFGCNPPTNDHYCPDAVVTREQMASFLVRAMSLGDAPADIFSDDDGSVHELDINSLYASGITRGCNPPVNDRFCPRDPVTRGEMAAFLHRALGGGILGGHVFEDADLDGVYDSEESPLQGVTVYLSGTLITRRSAVSDVRGGYAFGPLDPGEYMVEIPAEAMPPGSLATNETWHVVDVTSTSTRLDLDLGLRTPAGLEEMLVGSWVGTNTNPWVDTYAIEIEFGADGIYSSRTDAENWALYFGPDDDTPLKTYAVKAVGPEAVGSGEIAFVWLDNVGSVVRMGAMTSIDFANADRVAIEIWDRGEYGPVVLDLIRSGA